jgi:hypothetical protein
MTTATAKTIKATRALLTPQARAQAVIESWRGLPGELMMLKGLLCLEHTLQKAYEGAGAGYCDALAASEIGLDRMAIATRMDELRASGGGN